MAKLQREIDRLTSDKLLLYTLYSDNEIDKNEYISRRKSADEIIQKLSIQIVEMESKNCIATKDYLENNPSYELLKDFLQPLEYSNELIKKLIDCVVVHDKNNIEIKWKFEDIFIDKLSN